MRRRRGRARKHGGRSPPFFDTSDGWPRTVAVFGQRANIAILKKDDPNVIAPPLSAINGAEPYTDVYGLPRGSAGSGYDIGRRGGRLRQRRVPRTSLSLACYRNTLFHNNCKRTFTDVTQKRGLRRNSNDSASTYPPIWAEGAVGSDVKQRRSAALLFIISDY